MLVNESSTHTYTATLVVPSPIALRFRLKVVFYACCTAAVRQPIGHSILVNESNKFILHTVSTPSLASD